jgi:hypothetical protein
MALFTRAQQKVRGKRDEWEKPVLMCLPKRSLLRLAFCDVIFLLQFLFVDFGLKRFSFSNCFGSLAAGSVTTIAQSLHVRQMICARAMR